jgi:DNA-binding NtrC family response regulator
MEPTRSAHGGTDPATLWRHLQGLVARVSTALEEDTAVDDCLDVLVDLLGASRGLVVLETDGGPLVINARGPRRALSPQEREEVSETILRRTAESEGIVAWSAEEQPIESASVVALGIGAALAAPLRARGLPRGVLYVDYRVPVTRVDPAHHEFFAAATAVLAGLIGQAAATRAAREQLVLARSHVTESRRTPGLEELLAPAGMKKVRDEAQLALAGDSPVLVLGESGTGKTLLAQSLAEASGRKPIVRFVLGGSDDLNTITSELFGHERGSFSGATSKRVGLVEYAAGGTLVLDEVLNLPPHAQKLLLDFTQFGTYRPLGYDRPEPKRAAVRLVAVTNGDMRAAIREGRFREDLYYRLAGVTLKVPPLRERREDLPALAQSALRRADSSRAWTLSPALRMQLAAGVHAWPGNVRELEWAIRRARDRAVVRDRTAVEVRPEDLAELDAVESIRGAQLAQTASPASPADTWKQLQEQRSRLEEREVEVLRDTLARHGGVVAHAAKDLGIARTTLAGRVDALGLGRK